jgi:hypothetical protein
MAIASVTTNIESAGQLRGGKTSLLRQVDVESSGRLTGQGFAIRITACSLKLYISMS